MRLFSLISHCLLGITTHCHDWATAKSVFGDTTKILIVSLGIAAIMVHNVLLHNTLYAVGPHSPEHYLVVLGTIVSAHILLQVEGTQTCKDSSIGHLSGD